MNQFLHRFWILALIPIVVATSVANSRLTAHPRIIEVRITIPDKELNLLFSFQGNGFKTRVMAAFMAICGLGFHLGGTASLASLLDTPPVAMSPPCGPDVCL